MTARAMARIPFGLCQCGCGQETQVYKRTETARGQYKGERAKWLPGHNSYKGGIGPRSLKAPRACACGCGTPVTVGVYLVAHRPRRGKGVVREECGVVPEVRCGCGRRAPLGTPCAGGCTEGLT